jgi:hypothetical protein
MRTNEPGVEELRSWSARVCGYGEADREGCYFKLLPAPLIGAQKIRWRPDENIAQAMEVLEAIPPMLPEFIEWMVHFNRVDYFAQFVWMNHRKVASANHENRNMAILLAAHAAWQAKGGA